MMDPAEWEVQILRAARRGREGLQSLDSLQLSDCSTETKLSVREQAKQFEQQAFDEQIPNQKNDPQSSRSPILLRDRDGTEALELTKETLLFIMDYPYSPVSVGRDLPSRIIIIQRDELQPLNCQRQTPPVLRKFTSSISNYMTVQLCEITVEIIPDPPENPPPPPPPPQQPRPPSPLTSPPSSPPSSPEPPYFHQSQYTPEVSPPAIPKQNLEEIERSVANLYSQVDKNCKVPKFTKKPQVTAEPEGANNVPGSDPHHQDSTPNPSDSGPAPQITSASVNSPENETSQLNSTSEVKQTNQLNLDYQNTAELNENFNSESTAF
ncbi:hypothetical protein LDENG_00175910 [Lucifuga dentata]|nr:hypothetical protein LDENG_00175910 [Lucifuga dentata]